MPKGHVISKNGFKVWLQCKNCNEYFLVSPNKQYLRQYCSSSCATRFQARSGNRKIINKKISGNKLRIWLQCKNCDEYFLVLPCKQYIRQYCSKSCSSEFQAQEIPKNKSKVWLQCKNCDEYFLVPPRKQYIRQYCSRSCKSKSLVRKISKNDFKVWLQCKNCDEYFLALPCKQYSRQYCSSSCSSKLNTRNGNYKILHEKISKNDFKVWLQCKNCNEYFLVLPSDQYQRQCCNQSCASRLYFKDENNRKFQSDLMKRRRADITSDFNRNVANAARETAKKRNKTIEMKDAQTRYMMNTLRKNGFFIPPHQIKLYNNLVPHLGVDSLELEVMFDMKDTKLQSEFGQRWIRVDMFHKSSGVIVEVDGSSHCKTAKKDKCRDESLKNLGYQVIRIKNEEVEDDFLRKQYMLQVLREVINRESITLCN